MKEIWERIEKWLEENYPKGLQLLNSGATDEQIVKAEKCFGIQFSSEFKEFYKIHNGGQWELALIDGSELLSLEEMQSQWKVWKTLVDDGEFETNNGEPEKGISDEWYNLKWIPITHNGGGDHQCLDFAPTANGNSGQVIQMWHDWEKRSLIAASFIEWITAFANELDAGLYTYSDEYGVSKEINE
jgi:cell wall assembly regulator SMI1